MGIEQLLIKFFLLLFFSLSIFILLKPLSKRIPEKLFIDPTLSILSILKNRSTAENNPNLPIELQAIQNKIYQLLDEIKTQSKITAQEKIASQVAHDIRSPLLVLTHILNELHSLPEKKRIAARNAITRVTDIANNLLIEYKSNQTKHNLTSEPVIMLLESIISEKRIQTINQNINIELNISNDTYNAFIDINASEFKRVISNLINNAIEAIQMDSGLIIVSLTRDNDYIYISIKDNGSGIPEQMLTKVLEQGVSFNKNEGLGLGLSYAIQKITEWRGNYSLDSEVGKGTLFQITLPITKASKWFKEKINVLEGNTVVILDDDTYIHDTWGKRFPESFLQKYNLKIFHFTNSNQLVKYCDKNNIHNTLFLLDYEIGEKETGISLSAKLNLGEQATLVTSSYENNEIRSNCLKLGVKIIPKYYAEHIPIQIIHRFSTLEKMVLIDDNKAITDIWKESATEAGKDLDVFHNPNDFLDTIHNYPNNTFIYIDSHLGNDLKGENFAKSLYERGYTNIILETGYPKERFEHISWVKDVIEKNPPWEQNI